MNKTGGARHNKGKARLDLVPDDAIDSLADALEYGETKYAAWNWTKGFGWRSVIACLRRHVRDFARGEDFDSESGLPHTAHIMANAAFLDVHFKRKLGVDDRFKWHELEAQRAAAAPVPLDARTAAELREALDAAGEPRFSVDELREAILAVSEQPPTPTDNPAQAFADDVEAYLRGRRALGPAPEIEQNVARFDEQHTCNGCGVELFAAGDNCDACAEPFEFAAGDDEYGNPVG